MSALSSVLYGFIYRISNEENQEVGHLAGTYHDRIEPGDHLLSHEMNDAMHKSASIYLEVSPYEVGLFLGLSKDKIEKAIENSKSVEAEFMAFARAAKKDLKGVELPENYESRENQSRALCQDRAKLPQEQLKRIDFDSLFTEYLLPVAYKYGIKELVKSIGRPGFFHSYLKIQQCRNLQMAEKIHLALQNGEKPFIAIGCGHLWSTKNEGEKGVINLLREKGWKVERIRNLVNQNFLEECRFYMSKKPCKLKLYNSERAMNEVCRIIIDSQFLQMPPTAKDNVYAELYLIIKSRLTKDDFSCVEHAFHNKHGQFSTVREKAQAILNYLSKKNSRVFI